MFYDSSKQVAFIPRLYSVTVYPLLTSGNLIFLMNSSISNPLKWLFYLMHFPYSSWTKGERQGMKGDGPVDGHAVAHTKCTKCVPACVSWWDSGGLRSIVTPLHRAWEQFYSGWLLRNGSCNWPRTHTHSPVIRGRPRGRLNNRCGAHCQCFSLFLWAPIWQWKGIRRHVRLWWRIKNVAHGSALCVYLSSAAL